MVGGIKFKSMQSNPSGVWIRVREVNYLIEKGIIQVDEAALAEYVDSPDPEYNAMMMKSGNKDYMRDLLGREPDEVDQRFFEAGNDVKREIMQQMGG